MSTMWQGNWWAIALRAIAAILLGIVAFTLPGPTLSLIVIIFGVYALIDGVLALIAAARGLRRGDQWGAMLMKGVVGLIVGGIAIGWPGIGALGMVYLIACWALITGALEIAMAVRLRRIIKGEWFLILGGLLSVALAIVLILNPGAGVVGVMWMIGAYAIVYGFSELALAFRLRHWTHLNLFGPLPH